MQTALRVLGVDGLLQALQFALQSCQLGVAPLQQAGLKPPVEVFDDALALRLRGWDENRVDSKAQTDPQDPRQITVGKAQPTTSRTLSNGTWTGRLRVFQYSLRKSKHDFHFAGAVEFQAHFAIEGAIVG